MESEQEKQVNGGKNNAQNDAPKGKMPFIFGQKHEKDATKQPSQEKPIEEKKQPTREEKTRELTESIQRLQAEFENYQKRSTKQNEEFKVFANAKVIEEILPVIDSLEHGMLHNKEFVHIYEQLFSILKKKGLQKIHAEKGMKFNHDTMECMMQEKNPALKDDAVANVLITGYLLNGKVLRAVKVSVNSLANEKTENNEEENNEKEEKNSSEEMKNKEAPKTKAGEGVVKN
ncbi:MAG: nucleotide exchange factor GrpE [archaeon]